MRQIIDNRPEKNLRVETLNGALSGEEITAVSFPERKGCLVGLLSLLASGGKRIDPTMEIISVPEVYTFVLKFSKGLVKECEVSSIDGGIRAIKLHGGVNILLNVDGGILQATSASDILLNKDHPKIIGLTKKALNHIDQALQFLQLNN